jgi:hypothetical protein
MTLSKMLNLNAAIHFGLSAHQGLVSTPEYSATLRCLLPSNFFTNPHQRTLEE